MSTESIVEALAYINWSVLAALAFGTFALAYVLRLATDATAGYLGFTALCSSLLAGLLLVSDGSLPQPSILAIEAAPALDLPRRAAIAAFAVLALVAAIRYRQGRANRRVGLAALVAAVVAEACAAYGWAGGLLHGVPLLVQFLMLSAVTGWGLACVVLAHWYLVTPRISERPLVLSTRLLEGAVALQLVMFLTWQTVGSGGEGALASFTGPQALFVWLRLTVGLLFPLVLSELAYRTARTRSMESATGLLYIDLAAILASTIVAAALYFNTALLV
jgi:hypothetical protein